MLRRTLSLLTLVMVLATVLAACGSAPAASSPTAVQSSGNQGAATAAPAPATAAAPEATSAPTAAAPEATSAPTAAASEATAVPTVAPTNTPVNISTFDAAAAGNRTVVRWFVGLGAGTQPAQIPLEQDAVKKFNDSQDKIYLAVEIIDNTQAYNTLATQIAAGNAPDIIGPVGVRGRNGFKGQLLDISDLITKNKVDTSVYDPTTLAFYNVPGQGQIGLPYAIYPSFIYYNKDLFDEAGLPYPPQKFGEQYNGKEWNMDALRELAMKLTVDDKGNDATSADFNPDKIVQFGFNPQWVNQARPMGTFFGAASLVGPDGKAQIPEIWREAWQWFYDGMHKDHFIPSDTYANSDQFGNGNVFNSGKLAMAWTHVWYTCCVGDVKNWDIAVVPSYKGNITAKLHADTFSIMKATKHPDESFQVLMYLLNSPELIQAYGAMPAIKGQQDAFFKGLDQKFAPNKVNWQVVLDSLKYPDDPSHEEDLPNFLKTQDALDAFATLLRTKPGLDLKAEEDKLKTTLQTIFDEKQ